MDDPVAATLQFGHGDPIAPVIPGVTSILFFAVIGLVFAAIGRSLGLTDDAIFSAIVLMVIVTTLMAPPLLKIAVRNHRNNSTDA